MYFILEDNPKETCLIKGEFYTLDEARKRKSELENNYCNYNIVKLI